MARHSPSREAAEGTEPSEAVARSLRANAAVSEFLDWLEALPSVKEVRVGVGDEGATVWAVQDRDDLDEAGEAYLRVSELLRSRDTPYLNLLVGPRLESTDITLATAHKL